MRCQFLVLSISVVTIWSCFDDVAPPPPCFFEGEEPANASNEVSINACCEQSAEGNNFCQALFSAEGYQSLSDLAQCAPAGYCVLCEIGVNCACVSQRDCDRGQVCSVSGDAIQCATQLGDDFESQKCALCIDP